MVILIGNDTKHRRYIINSLIDSGLRIDFCIFEKKMLSAPFPTRPSWFDEEDDRITNLFSANRRVDLERVQVHSVESLNSDGVRGVLAMLNPSFTIVSGACHLTNQTVEKLGFSVNVHLGIAEKYRGLDSNLWAIYHGDFSNLGVTLHKLSHELDTGAIFDQQRLSDLKTMPFLDLKYYESRLAVRMLLELFRSFEEGRVAVRNQLERGRYYSHMPGVIKDQLPRKLATWQSRLK
jgi:methionyl-tRNA formyltransferase